MKIVFGNLVLTGKHQLFNIMKWMQLYLVITLLLAFFGPIDWKIRNPGLVVFYILSYQIMLWLGYRFAMRKEAVGEVVIASSSIEARKVKKITNLIYIGIISDVLMTLRMANSFNPMTIISKVVNGITSPASQYLTYNTEANAGMLLGGGIFSLLVTLLSPLTLIAIILGVYFYKELKFDGKCSLYILILIHFCMNLISAANEGIIDTAVVIIVPLFLRNQNNMLSGTRKQRKKINKKRKWMIIMLIISVVFVLSFFTSNIIGRTQGNFAFGTLGENKYNPDAPILQFIPKGLEVTLVYLSVYMCEGYYGFSLTTMVDWCPMFGAGFSSFIRNNLSSVLGVDLLQYTYQAHVEQISTWGALRNFHTAYTFWANDVSHIGVIPVMFIIGWVLAHYYKKSVKECSLSSIVIMPFLIIQIFYLPLNNKIFAQPASALIVLCVVGYDLIRYLRKGTRR